MKSLPPLSLFTLLIAAIIHDYGHPGVNNQFLYRIMDPLAIQFNGISVSFSFWFLNLMLQILENMHIKDAITLTMNNEEINWFKAFSHDEFLDFHTQLTHCVLATE